MKKPVLGFGFVLISVYALAWSEIAAAAPAKLPPCLAEYKLRNHHAPCPSMMLADEITTRRKNDKPIALFEKPFTHPEDVAGGLSEYRDKLYELNDLRGAFVAIYVSVTEAVDEVVRSGRIANSQWVDDLMINFANLYRQALLRDQQTHFDRIPRAWEFAFASNRNSRYSLPIQLLLAMNAHIMRDLVVALAQSGTDFNQREIREDYQTIGEIFGAVMKESWDIILKYDHRKRQPIEKKVSTEVITRWIIKKRSRAWQTAHSLTKIRDTDSQSVFVDQLDRKTAVTSRWYTLLETVID